MLIMRAPNSTNFRLTAEEAEALAVLVEEHGSVEITADEQRVKNAIERLLPTSANRLPLLKGFADTIQAAHESASGQWAISLTHDGLRLTVGHHYLATLHKDMLWVTFDPDVAGADVVATLQREGVELEPKTYAQLNASGVYLTAATVESLLPQIGDAQRKTMADAARGTLRDASKAAHVAAAIRLLQKLLGRTLPQPAYYGTTDMIDNKSQAIEPWQAKIKSRNPRVQKLVIDYSAWLRTTFGNVVEMQPDPDGTSLSVLIQGRIRQHCTYTPPNLLFFMSSCLTQTPRSGAPTREAECSTRVKA
jgi:predicted RNA binding protein with dsRBD fold (UPF0201 family)